MKTIVKLLMVTAGLFISGNLFAQNKTDQTYLQVLQAEALSIQAQLNNPSPLLSSSDISYLQALLVKTQGLIAQIHKPEWEQYQQELNAKNQPQPNANRILTLADASDLSAIPAFVSTGNQLQDEEIIRQWLIDNGLIKQE